ncbi:MULTISPECIES: hypothetical protein [unclassified Bradyrhizobium]|uniref:hypothetical protein n=1 Tax=unclassified Bradyrhizobium TaxID=2631580 RepID=UPI001FFB6AD1|nr:MULTISPECIES: hypothetical protein [unclassified Bradyrhizobium]
MAHLLQRSRPASVVDEGGRRTAQRGQGLELNFSGALLGFDLRRPAHKLRVWAGSAPSPGRERTI